MEEIKHIISGIAAGSPDRKENDFIADDGLLHCGVCGRKKETWVTFPASITGSETKTKVRCICKCDEERIAKEKQEREYLEHSIRIERLKDASLMDRNFENARFCNYRKKPENEKALKVAKKYADEFDRMYSENQGLIFYGPVGTGKSYTAACIANELMNRLVPVVMTSFVKILQSVQGMRENEEQMLAALNSAKLLILDDLGTERNTDYALEKVYNVVDSRVRAARPMILTTNLTYQELLNTQDMRYKRIYDRILETCYPVNIPGPSFRRSEAASRYSRMQELFDE